MIPPQEARSTDPLRAVTAAAGEHRIAHIDGLRAVAVIAVVGFHAGLPGFGGGFVGVDVFFVISGYLIINHIVDELRAGRFSPMRFYARRALRLLPPLLLVIAASTVLAAAILVSPGEWEWFTLSAVAAALFASNVYFLLKQGYFDLDIYEKPLLHTWSLAVEEQFYLVVPLLIVGCFFVARRLRRDPIRVLVVVAVVVLVASLAGSIAYTVPTGRNQAFYLMHWRAWEFAAGGLVGPLGRAERNAVPWGIAGLAGLALLVASNVLAAAGDPFPGVIAIPPVVATALLIAAGFAAPNSVATRLLAARPLVFVGLVSYGWYLWHWPLISFARIADFDEPSMLRDVAMAIVSFGLAVLTYRCVERPARQWRERAVFPERRRRWSASVCWRRSPWRCSRAASVPEPICGRPASLRSTATLGRSARRPLARHPSAGRPRVGAASCSAIRTQTVCWTNSTGRPRRSG